MFRFLPFCYLVVAAFFLSSAPAKYSITLTNPSSFVRTDEPVVITRKVLEGLTAKVPAGMVPQIKTLKGGNVSSQVDDLNDDDSWDELVFLYSLKANEKAQVTVEFVKPEQMPSYPLRAYAFLGISPERNNMFIPVRMETLRKEHKAQEYPNIYQLEGPCWENDKIGFRLYFDQRNGKDIFGKTSSDIVLERLKPKEEYHTKQPWGMDILKVNTSLGAGALAIVENGTSAPAKLTRLGENTGSTAFELIAKGPVRAIFRLHYTDWKVGVDTYNLTEEIRLYGGSYGYQSKVTLSGFTGERTLVTGIVNVNSDKYSQKKNNAAFTSVATHAKQSENKDYLGMALILKNNELVKVGETPKQGSGITQTYTAYLKAKPNVPVTFHFYGGWQGSNPKFADPTFFSSFIQQEADRLVQAVKVSK